MKKSPNQSTLYRLSALALAIMAASSPAAFGQVESDDQTESAWVRPLAELTAYREHPLFSPLRKPSPAVSSDGPSLSPKPGDHAFDGILVGILSSSGGDGVVLVKDTASETVTRVPLGGTYKDWTLTTINRHDAVFDWGDTRTTVSLDQALQNNAGAPAAEQSPATPDQP